MRCEDGCAHERADILGICWALFKPALNVNEAGISQPSLGLLRRGEDPGRPADELGSAVTRDRFNYLPNAVDIALASALDLKDAAWPKGPCQPAPQAIVVAYPVQRRGRDHDID